VTVTRRLICSWAQNATPVPRGFFESMRVYAQHNQSRLAIIKGRYRNPTSIWSEKDEADSWWDPAVAVYLVEEREQLCPNLALYADICTQPTAARPLSGFEVFCGPNSGIFGHPKRALECIPTAKRTPRIITTTGACTVPNYTDTKAGKKGHAHHALGALVIEIEDDGTYFLRHVSATKDGHFTDLDLVYTPDGVTKAAPALAMSFGDLHVGREEPAVLAATRQAVELLRPRHVFLHDALDFRARNHHERTLRGNYPKANDLVEDEVQATVDAINDIDSWGEHQTNVVRSNHDAALDRWAEECKPTTDLVNAPYYFGLWHRLFEARKCSGSFPDAFAMEAARMGVRPTVKFLGRNESITLKGVVHGFHGDVGPNGSRGNPNSFARLGVKTVTGHTHTACIRDGNFTAGVKAQLDHGYNLLPSTWVHADVVQYADGKRTLLFYINGKFRAAPRKPARPALKLLAGGAGKKTTTKTPAKRKAA
jgi:hypothetical protein